MGEQRSQSNPDQEENGNGADDVFVLADDALPEIRETESSAEESDGGGGLHPVYFADGVRLDDHFMNADFPAELPEEVYIAVHQRVLLETFLGLLAVTLTILAGRIDFQAILRSMIWLTFVFPCMIIEQAVDTAHSIYDYVIGFIEALTSWY